MGIDAGHYALFDSLWAPSAQKLKGSVLGRQITDRLYILAVVNLPVVILPGL